MFRNTFQSGFLSILYSIGNEPLQLWSCHVDKNNKAEDDNDETNDSSSHIKRVVDDTISSTVIELASPNLSNTYITCPASLNRTLGIKLPFIVLLVKNVNKYFSFEIQVLDDKNVKRRFRASNYQMTTRVKPYITTMPMRLDPGWNQVTVNLADYVKRAYGSNYAETSRVTLHANCRIRRIYFTDQLYAEDELPAEFKLFLPVS
ncbi:Cilia/flagella-associated protein 20/WDR90/C3orf67 [Radiomyces spectabilis]|uniref:Cilia/flagella-associated protein 20/WDR90/C3orf67 n=1 Tax=Radiomyces spectabilis TaxID=64574 RepID=UPI00221F4D9D|nr:Cilia/flagella-associated protein 20/WDR90/C3orf67 [Radiomyces spectabilis]KAI8384257.1 Cilia/flagella-associated protein 20/WDR90/C3orf67 [Radiomyces spectabilis]